MSASEDFQASNGMDDLPDFPPEFPGCEIQVHENDVLNGRGINIAQHPGNERFRALIQARFDPLYCTKYSVRCFKADLNKPQILDRLVLQPLPTSKS